MTLLGFSPPLNNEIIAKTVVITQTGKTIGMRIQPIMKHLGMMIFFKDSSIGAYKEMSMI